MKKILKYVLIVFLLILVSLLIVLIYVKAALPNVGDPENISVKQTAENIERGKYLANALCACMDCHSTRNWNRFSGPLLEGTLGKGGEEFSEKLGFPGTFYSKNLTPFHLKNWTDGELLRAISTGVSKNGKALFPVMPHPNYGKMDKNDLLSIIAYLRTLQPLESKVPDSKPSFPMNFIINTIPRKAIYSNIPDTSDIVAYGGYLVNAAACAECHTKKEKGKPVEGMDFAGGFEFPLNTGGIVRSVNITPDKETGIGNWTETTFVNRFKIYADSAYKPHKVKMGEYNTMMPWTMYSKLKTSDLKAMYAYLRTLKPVKNQVERFTPPSEN